MCDQCVSDSVKLGEVVPGWVLFFTRTSGPGCFVGAGMYCIAPRSSDAVAAWSPDTFTSADAIPVGFITGLTMAPEDGYALVTAALSGGYDPKVAASDDLGGVFTHWLYHRIRGLILAHPAHRE